MDTLFRQSGLTRPKWDRPQSGSTYGQITIRNAKTTTNERKRLTSRGRPVLKKSYSLLQDQFYRHMREAGYTDLERGERGSTEEHLTVTQFKVAQEETRLEVFRQAADPSPGRCRTNLKRKGKGRAGAAGI